MRRALQVSSATIRLEVIRRRMKDKKANYEDIINMEHPTSKKHPRMSALARAAQFAPFAALTAFDDYSAEPPLSEQSYEQPLQLPSQDDLP